MVWACAAPASASIPAASGAVMRRTRPNLEVVAIILASAAISPPTLSSNGRANPELLGFVGLRPRNLVKLNRPIRPFETFFSGRRPGKPTRFASFRVNGPIRNCAKAARTDLPLALDGGRADRFHPGLFPGAELAGAGQDRQRLGL